MKENKTIILLIVFLALALSTVVFFSRNSSESITADIQHQHKNMIISFLNDVTYLEMDKDIIQEDYYMRSNIYNELRTNACNSAQKYLANYECVFNENILNYQLYADNLVLSKSAGMNIKSIKNTQDEYTYEVSLIIRFRVVHPKKNDVTSNGELVIKETQYLDKDIPTINITVKKVEGEWKITNGQEIEQKLANLSALWRTTGDIYLPTELIEVSQ